MWLRRAKYTNVLKSYIYKQALSIIKILSEEI